MVDPNEDDDIEFHLDLDEDDADTPDLIIPFDDEEGEAGIRLHPPGDIDDDDDEEEDTPLLDDVEPGEDDSLRE